MKDLEVAKRLPSRKLKGQALIIAAIFIVLILIVLWSVVNIPALKSNQIEKDIEVRSEMHIMGNALDAAKLYMETGLAYSTYQACYDTIRNGGWDTLQGRKTYNGYALWDSAIVHPDKQELDESLKKSIKTNLELYRKSSYRFMTDYFVNIPSYDVEVVMYDPYQLSVGAWNNSNFYIEKTQESGEYIRLEKYGFLQGEYTIDCYGIYRKGIELYYRAREDITAYIQSIPTSGVDFSVLRQNFRSDVNSKINQTLAVIKIPGQDEEYDMSYDIKTAELTQIVVGAESSYNAEVKVLFEVTNMKDEQMFPIYDGYNVIMSPMTFSFVLDIKTQQPAQQAISFTLKKGAAQTSSGTGSATLSFSSYEYSDGAGDACLEEDMECFEDPYIMVSYAEDGTKLDETECPEEDPYCEEITQTVAADGWTVNFEGGTEPLNIVSMSGDGHAYMAAKKRKPYVKPLIPPSGTEYLQRIVAQYADIRGISRPLLFALVQQESRWKANARSRKGALGLMQIKPSTAMDQGWTTGEGSLYIPEINVKYGSKYLKHLLDIFKGDEKLALAAYNAGLDRVFNLITKKNYCKDNPTYNCVRLYLPSETLIYVPEVYIRYKKLYAALPGIGAV